MILRPLQDRVLILPQPPVEQTASGLAVVEHRKPEQVGTVVAVGWQVHPRKREAESVARLLEKENLVIVDETDTDLSLSKRAATLIRELVAGTPLVKVGDQVLFSWLAGQELLDADHDVRYLVMREADLLAVIED